MTAIFKNLNPKTTSPTSSIRDSRQIRSNYNWMTSISNKQPDKKLCQSETFNLKRLLRTKASGAMSANFQLINLFHQMNSPRGSVSVIPKERIRMITLCIRL